MMLRVAHTHDIIGVLDMCEGKKTLEIFGVGLWCLEIGSKLLI